jgi:hypothetical protein
VFYAVVGIAISSLSDRRVVAGASIIGLLLVTSTAAAVIGGDNPRENGGSPAGLLNILALPIHLRDLVFLGHIDPESPLNGVNGGGALAVISYLAVLVVALAILLRRYRWVER